MPRQVCAEAGCPCEPISKGRCPTHATVQDKSYNRLGKKVYNSKQWERLRLRKLSLNPICERCSKTLAIDVHHMDGVENNPWELERLESLCKVCHGKETKG